MTNQNPNHARPSGQNAAGSALGKLPPDPLLKARLERFHRERCSDENRLLGSSVEMVNKDLDKEMETLKVGQVWQLDDPAMIIKGRVQVFSMPPILIVEGPYRTPNDVFVRAVPLECLRIGWKEISEDEVVLQKGRFRFFSVYLWEERPISYSIFDTREGILEELDEILLAREKLASGRAVLQPLSDFRSMTRQCMSRKFQYVSHLVDWRRYALEEFTQLGGDIKKYVPHDQLCDGSGGWVTDNDIDEILDAMRIG